MQLQGVGGSAVAYTSAMDCFLKMGRQEGVKSLYRGLTATIIRGVPNTGIQFAVYEGLKTLLMIA
jgi:solute carrier family 25 carnitine/acylcarnitine transporter 20/29